MVTITGVISASFGYDGDGRLVKRLLGVNTVVSGTTVYAGPHFEAYYAGNVPPPPPTPNPTPNPTLTHRSCLPLVVNKVTTTPMCTGSLLVTKYYLLGEARIAQRDGCSGLVSYLYRDHLGSALRTSTSTDDDTTRY